eukprot:2607675-Lingulodinium_polyedra.AAC.1
MTTLDASTHTTKLSCGISMRVMPPMQSLRTCMGMMLMPNAKPVQAWPSPQENMSRAILTASS